jgi:protein-tyrosine phosphatase
VRSTISELQPALNCACVPLTVLPGNEIYLTPNSPELPASGTVSSLGEDMTALVGISLFSGERPLYLDDLIFRLQLRGYRVVLAHPERYAFIERNVNSLDTLVAGGLLPQLTAPALPGDYGGGIRRTAEQLLRRGSYARASSDRHHPGPLRSLAALHERVSALIDSATADALLSENPARVLDNETTIELASTTSKASSFFARVRRRDS